MARSPFQGTFQHGLHPTVVLAPDAIVYINGETDVIGCGDCRRKFDFNKYITSIQVDLNIDSPPGSATINMAIPRHSVDDFFFDGSPVLTEMMEVEIYAKGHFLVEGMPQYYPIFWGIVTQVSDNYSAGHHTVTIQCNDILKWWEISRMNIHAAYTIPTGQMGREIFGNVFFGTNPYDVIWSLAQQSFGDILVATGSLTSYVREAAQRQTFNAALGDIMLYWEQRFRRIRSNLLLYGTNGVAIRGDSLYQSYLKAGRRVPKSFASTAIRNAQAGETQAIFDPASSEVVAFRTQFGNAGQIDFWQSEYETKLNLANTAKEAIGYEFYMDVTGDIVFKPPFYNLDIIPNKPISWIQDIDVIDWNFTSSEAEVVTQLQIQGNFQGNIDYGFSSELTPFTSVTDYHLLRKYGWRPQTYNSEFLGDPMRMFYVGMDVLDRMNSRRHHGTVTIPLRPELRLGFPIYIAPKDQIWYVQGISHNITMGGQTVTSLTLTAKREKFKAPQGIGSMEMVRPKMTKKFITARELAKSNATFELKLGDAASLPPTEPMDPSNPNDPNKPLILRHPKTGRVVGYPNAVIAYTRPFTDVGAAKKAAGIKDPKKNIAADHKKLASLRQEAIDDFMAQFTAKSEDELYEKHLTNRFQYGLNSAGVYTYVHDKSKAIQEITLLPAKNVQTTQNGKPVKVFEGSTGMLRPVSDERGFELIGHFRYGRGVSLRDGSLVLNEGENNSAAQIGTQLALSGNLNAMLLAQSQGLTTSTPMNPADAIANMSLSDEQTAGILNPSTKEPEFVRSQAPFVDTAPLGSADQKGFQTSVEAGQLSRALTLAEMTLKDEVSLPNEDCHCLFRDDLAFLTKGYQIKTIQGTMSEDLFVDEDGRPVLQSSMVTSGDGFIAQVEKYLFDLYSDLDRTHSEREKELRGGSSEGASREDRFESAPESYGRFSRPFSAPNRAHLGDPNAIVASMQSNAADIGKAWSEFGDKLHSNAERARLTSEIARDQAEIQRLQQERETLTQGSTTFVGVDVEKRLQEIDEHMGQLDQSIQDKSLRLSQVDRKG